MAAVPRTDVSGIVYIIENAQQFWSGKNMSVLTMLVLC